MIAKEILLAERRRDREEQLKRLLLVDGLASVLRTLREIYIDKAHEDYDRHDHIGSELWGRVADVLGTAVHSLPNHPYLKDKDPAYPPGTGPKHWASIRRGIDLARRQAEGRRIDHLGEALAGYERAAERRAQS